MTRRQDPLPAPRSAVHSRDRAAVNALIERVAAALDESDTSQRSIILAALAELSARYMQKPPTVKKNGKGKAAS